MSNFTLNSSRRMAMLAKALILGLVVQHAFAFTDDKVQRPAEQILAELETVQLPEFDGSRREDQEYLKTYLESRNKAERRRAELALELYSAHPQHEKVIELMPERWRSVMYGNGDVKTEDLQAELDSIIEQNPESKLAIEARYCKAQIALNEFNLSDPEDVTNDLNVIEAFIAAAPSDERGAGLLSRLAGAHEKGSAEQLAIYDRIIQRYPDSRQAKFVKGKIRQTRSIGKPFELEFNDAISQKKIVMGDLRGKVVVIDFWATWCGPCVAEMPKLKDLYTAYHDQGLEIIGISLDNPEDKGGLEKLRKFVEEKELPWLQYYQGNGWESEFSTGWGINSIPTVFVVDRNGVLHSTEARGKLEEMIPTLLGDPK